MFISKDNAFGPRVLKFKDSDFQRALKKAVRMYIGDAEEEVCIAFYTNCVVGALPYGAAARLNPMRVAYFLLKIPPVAIDNPTFLDEDTIEHRDMALLKMEQRLMRDIEDWNSKNKNKFIIEIE